MPRLSAVGRVLSAVLMAVISVPGFGQSETPDRDSGDTPDQNVPRDVLDVEAEGLVEVRFIANDARSAQVIVTNRGDRPLTLRLPPAFAGVPVLAQNQGAGFQNGGIGAQPQNTGGGGMQNQGGFQGGNPFGPCWVARAVYGVHDPRWVEFRQWLTWRAPAWLQSAYVSHGEAVADWLDDRPVARAAVRLAMDQALAHDGSPDRRGGQLRVTAPIDATAPFTVLPGQRVAVRISTVCLDYGLREPTPRIPYRLVLLDEVSQDPRLAVILGGLASGHLSQRVAQAAAWHVSSGRTWEQLAAEMIDRAGGDPDVPFFSRDELAAAHRAVTVATRMAASSSRPEGTTETADGR